MRQVSRLPVLLRKVASCRPEQLRFAVAAWFAAPVIELSLVSLGLGRTLRWIEATSRTTSTPGPRTVSTAEASHLLNWAYRLHIVRGACLPRSLVQYWLHRRDGTPARFVVGVRQGCRTPSSRPTPFEAHAWVESPGSPCCPDGYESLLTRENEASAP